MRAVEPGVEEARHSTNGKRKGVVSQSSCGVLGSQERSVSCVCLDALGDARRCVVKHALRQHDVTVCPNQSHKHS